MGRYDDVIEFLASHEDKTKSRMNQRTTLNSDEVQELCIKYPGIPEDYVDYLFEIGWGPFRECQYMVYGSLIEPKFIFDDETVAPFQKRVLCFGDNFSGDPAGFLPDENWKVIEIWHDSLDVNETNQTFCEFVREQMLMDEHGNDLRSR